MYTLERKNYDENLIQEETLINDNSENYFILNDQQKLVILITAVILFFLTLIITICIVSPICLLRKLLHKFGFKNEDTLKSKTIIKPSLSPDSKSFQLTVVPQYVEKRKLELELNKKNDKLNFLYKKNKNSTEKDEKNDFWLNMSPKRKNLRELFKNKDIRCNSFFLNDKSYIEKTYEKWNNRLNKTKSLDMVDKNIENNLIKTDSQIEIILSLKSENISKNNVRLHINLKQVNNLPLKLSGLEPSFYIIIKILNNNSSIYKTSIKKQNKFKIVKYQSEIFKTKTNLNLSYITEEIVKNYFKESKLLIRVMAVDKHTNDYCLGETLITLKQFLNEEKIIDNEAKNIYKAYKLEKSKEIKGELLLSVCFLPTSKRATFKVIKANLNKQLNLLDFTQNYFIRIIMICNGKVIKKKKTSCNGKLDWQFNEIINFDLSNLIDDKINQLCFLIVLSSYKENESSSLPSSPDTPNDNLIKNNLSLKPVKNAIAHFVLNKENWNQICREPRKKIEQWVKLI